VEVLLSPFPSLILLPRLLSLVLLPKVSLQWLSLQNPPQSLSLPLAFLSQVPVSCLLVISSCRRNFVKMTM